MILEELGFGGLDGLEIARSCKCRFGTVVIGDVVGLRPGGGAPLEIGEVVLLLHWSGSRGSHAILSLWERDSATATFGHTWRLRSVCRGMSLRETSAMDVAFVYSRDSPTSDVAIVIVPPRLR